MNYLKHYESLIAKAKRRKSMKGYYEIHHILPKSLGGLSTPDNLIKLSAREHFVAHWLLHRAYPNNSGLALAFKMMSTTSTKDQQRYTPSSRVVAEAMEAGKKAIKQKLTGVPKSADHVHKVSSANKGKKRSLEVRKKLSSLKKGKPSTRGKTISQYTLDGVYIKTYSSVLAAEKELGIESTNIRSAIRGTYKQSGGYLWKDGRPEEAAVWREELLKKINAYSDDKLKSIEKFLSTAPPEIANNLRDGH
jgi:hypothetical protein